MKESGFRIRIDAGLRSRFIEACRAHDLTAAQVLRRFMKEFVENGGWPQQGSLFITEQESVDREASS